MHRDEVLKLREDMTERYFTQRRAELSALVIALNEKFSYLNVTAPEIQATPM